MAAGLGLTTSPATDAIMGALPRGKAGAGSAVNDTTREVGGTLGVAVIGSVLSSAYSSRVAAALAGLGVPATVVTVARQSVAAGATVAGHLPPAQREAASAAVSHAFVAGVHAGSLVAAAAAAAAAVMALLFLPARATREAATVPSEPAHGDWAADAQPGAAMAPARPAQIGSAHLVAAGGDTRS